MAAVLLAAGGTIWLAAFQVYQPARRSAEPIPMRPGEVSRATEFGHLVRVAFELPLLPTADPRVFVFHPGYPPAVFPPTVRVEFAAPPPLPLPAPLVVVVGTLDRREGVGRRTNGETGVVVISGAVVVPRTSR